MQALSLGLVATVNIYIDRISTDFKSSLKMSLYKRQAFGEYALVD